MGRSERNKPAAFLWDESFLWGLMACKALRKAGLPFDLLRSEDVRAGRLEHYRLLFVPGGWASNKLKVLGNEGARAIREFVRQGGSYVGVCGGAGLATRDGIGLASVQRRPTQERVPSFSGRIRVNTVDHPLWEGIADPVFPAWWPSQFVVQGDAAVLASYDRAMPDAFSSDVNVGDADAAGSWKDLEADYGINLDPKRLQGEPAVIEAVFGRGKVLLSLLHFDTPGDANGQAMLEQVWNFYAGASVKETAASIVNTGHGIDVLSHRSREDVVQIASRLEAAAADIIELGERNFLWFRREPLLLQWRRGVRGLEYCTLFNMLKEIADLVRSGKATDAAQLRRIEELMPPFAEQARHLLLRERFAMQKGHITYERCDDPQIQSLREELFSRSKSHGGKFKTLIDEIDRCLFNLFAQQGEDA